MEQNQPAASDFQLLTVVEAAKILRLSRSSVYELMDAGKLRYARLPGTGKRCSRRIPLSVIRKFVEAAMVGHETQ